MRINDGFRLVLYVGLIYFLILLNGVLEADIDELNKDVKELNKTVETLKVTIDNLEDQLPK